MLVTFNSSTSGQILMFADAARRLFNIVGKEGTARGVFTAEQLPGAIEKLKNAVAAEKASAAQNVKPQDAGDPGDEEKAKNAGIGLAQRAHPLIELMERTHQEEGFVMWEAASDF
jgi:hypothetical protein